MWTDTRGLEGLPLKLLVTALIVAIALPVIFQSLGRYENDLSLSEIRKVAERAKNVALAAFLAGPGNTRILTIPDANWRTKGPLLGLGGSLDDPESLWIDCLMEGNRTDRVFLDGPHFHIITGDGRRCQVGAGDELRFSCEISGKSMFVKLLVS